MIFILVVYVCISILHRAAKEKLEWAIVRLLSPRINKFDLLAFMSGDVSLSSLS